MLLTLPPVHFLLLAAGLKLVWYLEPEPTLLAWPVNLLALLPITLGLFLLVSARLRFARARTTVMTFDMPRHLVTDGVYAWGRNPMYLGFVLLLAGGAMLVGHPLAFLAPAAFFALASLWYIPHEEKAAAAAFGSRFEAYRAATRRWF